MNYEEMAQLCYDNKPDGALFASDDYWLSILLARCKSERDAKLAFMKLVDLNYFHKLNNRNYILNYKYFRKYGARA